MTVKQASKANELLRQAREEKNWTQSDLAEKLQVEEQTVGSWERGTRFPGLKVRGLLCATLAKTPEQLGLQPTSSTEQISQQLLLPTALPDDSTLALLPQDSGTTGDAVLPSLGIASHFAFNQVDKNRQRMLKRVHSRWIADVLASSLHHADLIRLNLQAQPDAVENPWRLFVAESDLPPRLLPAGMQITPVYDEADGELLILGEPGAGKTTLLLELARDLLDRAEQDPNHLIPVIFNLSSWAIGQQPLAEWLVEELSTKYRVSRKIGQKWIDTNQLILLLDGLDEVAEAARLACIKAINAYQQTHELVPIVVCCRKTEYFAGSMRVALQLAVVVQPLTKEQISDYLASVGEQLQAVHKALEEDVEMYEVIKTPLMLSIVTLAYQGETSATFATAGSIEARRQQVFATYVQRMLGRRGTDTCYTQQQTKRWLAWLARQLAQQSQTEFYLERMPARTGFQMSKHSSSTAMLLFD